MNWNLLVGDLFYLSLPQHKDLVKVVNNGPIDDDDNELDTMSYSPYVLPSNIPSNMINTNSPFGILSLQSLVIFKFY